ncbi:hypothetical protein ACIQC9_07005 [Brevundimonas sp. NPDC092305]|uniref:hypothetical protein n=1 Tax=Brevundimonas sp. NPDC092305 TaxID=3363957 RepID=UPI00380AEABA
MDHNLDRPSRRATVLGMAALLGGCGRRPDAPPAGEADALVTLFQGRRPSGPWSLFLAETRINGVDAWIWRPAMNGQANADTEVLPDAYAERLRRRFGASVGEALVAAPAHGAWTGAPADDRFPVAVFQPGATFGSRDYRLLIEDMASHGRIVIGLNPLGSPRGDGPRARTAADEIAAVLDGLGAVAPATRSDIETPGADLIGHSIGGAAAVLALAHPAARSAVNIDGDYLGAAADASPGKPMLYLVGENPDEPASADERRARVWGNISRGSPAARALRLPGMGHLDVTDGAVLAALAADGAPLSRGDPSRTHPILRTTIGSWLSAGPRTDWRAGVGAGSLVKAFG